MADRRPARGKVLVVEDEAYVRDSLGELLASRGYDVRLEAGLEPALRFLDRAPVDLLITDLRMPGGGGLELVREVRSRGGDVPVVILTGFGTVASAVECMKAGASDYILKPVDPDVLEVAIEKSLAARALRREVEYLRAGGAPGLPPDEAPTGVSPAWRRVMATVQAAARTGATVLLLGESGTGKEVLARLIHRMSPRAGGPYVRVNCAAIPIEMWESEFFGHRRGSFTGAQSDREGRFRLAHRGTIFMDEVGSMAPAAQAKFLRVLQDGEFDRLGDEQPTRVDVRVVAATNSDLDADVAAGRFRQDLFYRLNVMRIAVPPLRERSEDVRPLAERFVREICARLGKPAPPIAPGAMDELAAYAWPGNVRELRNVVERALILHGEGPLSDFDLPASRRAAGAEGEPAAAGPPSELNLRAALAAREKEILAEALRRSGGVRREAARLLGIDQRNLGYYVKKHNLDPDAP
ncbi:MAG TPA: sigma-54 dependent transcriptional regulator [Candidatus Polarisedimenticolia bacterium]|nr:sigma-54 dependent transcriptional regulator [Candidatus Polarisedimenticolia bacterium]